MGRWSPRPLYVGFEDLLSLCAAALAACLRHSIHPPRRGWGGVESLAPAVLACGMCSDCDSWRSRLSWRERPAALALSSFISRRVLGGRGGPALDACVGTRPAVEVLCDSCARPPPPVVARGQGTVPGAACVCPTSRGPRLWDSCISRAVRAPWMRWTLAGLGRFVGPCPPPRRLV